MKQGNVFRPRPYASVKMLSPWQANANRYNTGNSFFERPLPVYFSLQNAWRKSGVIICSFTWGFLYGLKWSTRFQANQQCNNYKSKKRQTVDLLWLSRQLTFTWSAVFSHTVMWLAWKLSRRIDHRSIRHNRAYAWLCRICVPKPNQQDSLFPLSSKPSDIGPAGFLHDR